MNQNIKLDNKKIRTIVIAAVIILAVIILGASSIAIVPAGHRGILLNMGAVSDRVLDEGLNFKIPFVQSVKPMDVRLQKFESTDNSSASKDLQTVTSTIAVNYRVDSNAVNQLYRNLGANYENTIISPAISESIKAVTAQYTAEELIVKRAEVSEKMKNFLQEKLNDKYIYVDSFNVVDFQFSEAYNKAIEEKQIAEQNALKAKYDLERVKTEVEQTIAQAEGEAEAMKLKNQQVTEQIIYLEFINKWDGKMPTYYGGGDLMFAIGAEQGAAAGASGNSGAGDSGAGVSSEAAQ